MIEVTYQGKTTTHATARAVVRALMTPQGTISYQGLTKAAGFVEANKGATATVNGAYLESK